MTNIEKNLMKEIKENNKAELFNRNRDIPFDRVKEIIENMGSNFHKKDICAFSELNYLNVRFGTGDRHQIMESLYFHVYNQPSIFEESFEKKEDLITFFNQMEIEFLPDFFNLMVSADNTLLAKIDMELLPELNQELFQLVKEKLENDYNPWQYGYYKDISFGAKKTFQIVYCKKTVLDKNIALLCRFTQAYCKKLMKTGTESKDYERFYHDMAPLLLNICSEEMNQLEIASAFIAHCKNRHCIKTILDETALDTTEIVMEAILKEPKCYVRLPQKYQLDKDICIHVLHTDLSCVYDVIRYGKMPEEQWREKLIEIIGDSYDKNWIQ